MYLFGIVAGITIALAALVIALVALGLYLSAAGKLKRFESTLQHMQAQVAGLQQGHGQSQGSLQPAYQAPTQVHAEAAIALSPTASFPPPTSSPILPATSANPEQWNTPAPAPSWRAEPAAYSPPARRSAENLFGRNVFGFIAAALVFLGLIFLGFLVLPYLTDTIKIVLMFAASAGLSVAGYLLNRRYHNSFTLALLGCGCGAFFISLQVTHLYFGVLHEIAAYILLLVWMVAALFIERQTQSLVVSIVAHMGMVFSVCAGYAVGMSDSKLLLLMGYQLISSAVIVGGNILCCKKMYRPSLFLSLLLTLYASLYMWFAFMGEGGAFASTLPVTLISGAFIVQFLASSFLAYLLFVSIARIQSTDTRLLLQAVNTLLWLGALILNITLLIGKLVLVAGAKGTTSIPLVSFETIPLAFSISLLILYLMAVGLILLRRVVTFARDMETLTVVFLLSASCALLIYQMMLHFAADPSVSLYSRVSSETFGPTLVYFVVPVLVCLLLLKMTNNRTYMTFAFIVLGAESLYMIGFGYVSLTRFSQSIIPAFVYLALLLVLLWLVFRSDPREQRTQTSTLFKALGFLGFEISILSIMLPSAASIGLVPHLRFAITLLLLLCASLTLRYFKQEKPRGLFLGNLCVLTVLLAAGLEFELRGYRLLAFSSTEMIVPIVLYVVACLSALILIFGRLRAAAVHVAASLRDPAQTPVMPNIEVLTVIALHILLFSIIRTLTGNYEMSYAFSLICMGIALLIVLLGFWMRTKSIRLYGLIVILCCVLKLVVFDVGGLDLLMRVIAFIAGGLICFGISALYNFVVKRFE